MNNRMCGLILALPVVANAIGGELMSSGRSAAFSIDTATVTNPTLTVNGSMLPLRLDYSSSLWNDVNSVDDSVHITANRIIASEETVFEETGEGFFFWSPTIVGIYSISLTSSNGITLSKTFNVVAATVTIEREGYNLCKLTASDGVSEMRYTTDGTAPTADSPLYTEPFEVPPSRLSFVRAATFSDRCPQGEVAFAHFNPVASFVSAAQANCAIDNRATKLIGYDAISFSLPYDTAWEGDESCSVELCVNGELIEKHTGAGHVVWVPELGGSTTLTLRTINASGGILAEYLAQYDVVPRVITYDGEDIPLDERYPGLCHWITNIIVEAGVTNIADSAFAGCSGLTSVTIPGSVTSIGSGAFSGCSGLTRVMIPASVTSIGNGAFDGCTNVTDVVVPGWKCNVPFDRVTNLAFSDGTTNIKGYEFSGCSGLTNVTIPNSVTNIGNNAFYGCSGLTSVTIPDSVTSIGKRAFYGCSGLTSVTIPSSVTNIGDRAFCGCSGLPSFFVAAGNANYSSANGLLLTKDGKTLIQGVSGDVTIPNSVTGIVEEAFFGCSGLTSVTIPDSVTSIGKRTFYGCSDDPKQCDEHCGRGVFRL